MIVCHCHGVSERAIRKAVRSGACTHGEVARTCKAGVSCGGCAPAVREILESERRDTAARSLPSLSEPATV
jgi:bacterioferritin-associated ferredoxin